MKSFRAHKHLCLLMEREGGREREREREGGRSNIKRISGISFGKVANSGISTSYELHAKLPADLPVQLIRILAIEVL